MCSTADLNDQCFSTMTLYQNSANHFSKIDYVASDGSSGFVGFASYGGLVQTAGEPWYFGPTGCATGFDLSFQDDSPFAMSLLTIRAHTQTPLLTVPNCVPTEATGLLRTHSFNVNDGGSRTETIFEDSS